MHLKKEPVSIKVGSASASSDPTDYGVKAYYYFKTAANSKGGANVSCMAGWKGSMYPYTLEGSFIVKHSGGSGSTTVFQSKTSRFYIKVFSSCQFNKREWLCTIKIINCLLLYKFFWGDIFYISSMFMKGGTL